MKDVRVDDNGDFHCWKCGGRNFTLKRTARSKVLFGVGSLVTKKKLKCQSCGEYNDVGNAKPLNPGPSTAPLEARVGHAAWAKDPTGRHELRYWDGAEWTEHVSTAGKQSVDPEDTNPDVVASDLHVQLRNLAELRDEGILTEEEFNAQKARLLG